VVGKRGTAKLRLGTKTSLPGVSGILAQRANGPGRDDVHGDALESARDPLLDDRGALLHEHLDAVGSVAQAEPRAHDSGNRHEGVAMPGQDGSGGGVAHRTTHIGGCD
jgi:hypothetical protein